MITFYGLLLIFVCDLLVCQAEDNFGDFLRDDIPKDEMQLLLGRTIWTFMNHSADPCEDFYDFACGNWGEKRDETTEFSFLNVDQVTDTRIGQYLTKIVAESNEDFLQFESEYKFPWQENTADLQAIEQNVRVLYESCVNNSYLTDIDQESWKNIISSYGLHFPIEQPENPSDSFDWLNVSAYLRKSDFLILIEQQIKEKYGYNEIIFDQSIPYVIFADNETIITTFDTFLGENLSNYSVNNLVSFLEDLQKCGTQSSNLQQMSLKDVQEQFPNIDFLRYLSILQNREPDFLETVYIRTQYYQCLNKILGEHSVDTIRKYMFLELLSIILDIANSDCMEETVRHLESSFGLIYIRRKFSESIESDVQPLIDEFKENFLKILDQMTWFGRRVKCTLMRKIEDTEVNIGYSKEEFRRQLEHLKGIELIPNDFWGNLIFLRKLKNNIDQSSYKQKEIMKGPEFNIAFYSQSNRALVIPAGYLNPPNYHKNYPTWAKIANLGSTFGHELFHAIDYENFLYDTTNKYNPDTDLRTVTNYLKIAICFARKYNKYRFKEHNIYVDGIRSVNENMADYIGLVLAYKTYKNWIETHPDEFVGEQLPELNFTPDQIFFIQYGQRKCHNFQESEQISLISSSVHLPSQFRLRGALSNLEEFSNAFNCPVGSVMNPLKRCPIL